NEGAEDSLLSTLTGLRLFTELPHDDPGDLTSSSWAPYLGASEGARYKNGFVKWAVDGCYPPVWTLRHAFPPRGNWRPTRFCPRRDRSAASSPRARRFVEALRCGC